ncbi:MAG TPA: response regulator [Burkholderiaceae bacterium]|nr:response regulator [Burkholderiaceae bacterium]
MGKRVLQVAAFGLKANEQSVLSSISVLSSHSSRAVGFDLAADGSTADLYLVDIDSEEAVGRWRICDPTQARPVIAIESQGKASAAKVLRRPLLASRLLAALDEVAMNAERFGPRTLLPISPAVAALASQPAAATVASAPRVRQAVLVVDDSPTVRKQLELVLRARDVDPTLVATGEHALDEIAQREFDLVLLDVVLPGTDGYQVCKAIKKGFSARRTPVVMLTSRSSPFDRLRGSLAGCDSYLVKPVRQSEFEVILTKYLAATPAPELKLAHARPVAA